MYNRYVPQPDGSYRRNRIQDAQRPASAQAQQQAHCHGKHNDFAHDTVHQQP